MLRLRILGPAELGMSDGTSLRAVTDQPKLLALASYLALASSRGPQRRETLLPLFWPDSDDAAARHALSQTWSVLRSTLGPELLDGKYRDTVELNCNALWCDVIAFRTAIEQDRLDDALELYRGPLLPGLFLRNASGFERWLENERRNLQQLATGAALSLSGQALAVRRWTEGRRWAERALGLDPYEERAWRDLITSMAGSGNRAKALATYERMRFRFQKDLEMEPGPETVELVGDIAAGSSRLAEGREESGSARAELSSKDNVSASTEPQVMESPSIRESRSQPRPQAGVVLAIVAVVILLVAGTTSIIRERTTRRIDSLVVLPLVDLSLEEGDEYFADALTAELGHALSEVEGLSVISHGSASLFRARSTRTADIARELRVDALIEGQLQRQDTTVRVTLQIVDGRTDNRIWSGVYEAGTGAVSGIPRQFVVDAAKAIGFDPTAISGLSTQERQVDPIAYDAYLRGLHHLERYNIEEARVAVRYLEEAVDREPGFAPAHAALARACTWSWDETTRPADAQRCETAAREAIRLDDSLAEGHAALGFVLLRALLLALDPSWDWAAAEHEFREAIRLNPSSAAAQEDYAELLRVMRRLPEAKRTVEAARRLDPLSPGVELRAGIQAMAERRFVEALDIWNRILETDPTYATAHYARGATYITLGMPAEVLLEADELARRLGDRHLWVLDLRAHGHALAGDVDRALEYARLPDGTIDWLIRASVFAVLGEVEMALDNLETSLAVNPGEIPNLTASERFDELRDHPRFVAVRKAVGLE